MARTATMAGLASLVLATSPALALPDVQYVYDSAGRLIRATYASGATIEYRYDAAGNRQQIILTGPPNSAPVANSDTASVTVSNTVVIPVLANDTDADGDTLSVTAVSTVSGGGVAVVSGGGAAVSYTAPSTTDAKTFTYTVSDGRGGSSVGSVTVTVTPPPADPVPDPVNWNDTTWSTAASYGGNATNNVTISGINQPIVLTFDVTTVTENFDNGYVYVYVNGANVGNVHYAQSGAGSVSITVSNGDQISLYIDGVTSSGIRSGSARINVTNSSTGGTFLDTFAFEGIVDNDNNYNTADTTPDPVDWSDTTWSTGAPYGGNATNNVTITGINQPISLTVDVTTVTTNFADGYVYAYVNGFNVGNVHYSVSGPGSFTISVSNGDLISFYIDGVTTYGIRSGSARVNIYNSTNGGAFVDTFAFVGIVDSDNDYNIPP